MLRVTIFTKVKTKKGKEEYINQPTSFQVRDLSISTEQKKWDLFINHYTRISILKSNYSSEVNALYGLIQEKMEKRWIREEMIITLVYQDYHKYQILPNLPMDIIVRIDGMKYHFKNSLNFLVEKKEQFVRAFEKAVPRTYTKPAIGNKFQTKSTLVDTIETNLDKYLNDVSMETVNEDTKNLLSMLKEIEKLQYNDRFGKHFPTVDFETCFLRYVIDELSDELYVSSDYEKIKLGLKALTGRVRHTITIMKLVKGSKPLRVILGDQKHTFDTQMVQRMIYLFYNTINFCIWYGYHISREDAISELMANVKYILDLRLEKLMVSTTVSQFLLYLETIYDTNFLYASRNDVDKIFIRLEKLSDYVTNILHDISTVHIKELESGLGFEIKE